MVDPSPQFNLWEERCMKFSVSLPQLGVEPDAREVDGLRSVARTVETVGLHAISGSDHPFPRLVPGRAGHQTMDPFVLLGHLGAVTERIALHFSLLITPYRNPFLSARMLSTLDLLAPGRVIVGLGAGYLEAEFAALGADFEHRSADVVRSVAAMRAAWTAAPVVMEGPGWRADGNVMLPAPFTSPSLTLWRGGNTRTAAAAAVRDFDGWAPFEVGGPGAEQTVTTAMSLATLPARVSELRDIEQEQGRTRPLDICYVRTSRRWLASAASIVEDLQRLDAAGVQWVEFSIFGRSTPERVDGLHAFAEAARVAGVL
jgi:probable F420-dependent oxidoreductase